MNHTTPFPMETSITNETLIEQQQRIVSALQLEVLMRIQQGVQYRRELESVGFATELLGRLKSLGREPDEDSRGMATMSRCY